MDTLLTTLGSGSTLSDRALAFLRRRSAPAWLVGGFVRDRLLGRPNHDLDVIVPDGGIRTARAVAEALGGAFFVLDRERDVGRAVLRNGDEPFLYVDVARFRAPELLDDLAYRDFTINAIAVDLAADAGGVRVFDPFDGRRDLTQGVIRAVTEGAFVDDPLRMLRGVRLAVELGFHIEDGTLNLIRRDASHLVEAAAERVRDELVRILAAPGAWQHLRTLAALDLLRFSLPESAALIGIGQSAPHYLDVFDHTRAVVAHLEGVFALLWPGGDYTLPAQVEDDPVKIADAGWASVETMLRPWTSQLRAHLEQPLASGHTRRHGLLWAAAAHDWGKSVTRSVGEDGRVHFYEHEHRGAEMVELRARALMLSAVEVNYLKWLVALHMRPGHLSHDFPPTRRALYRFLRDAGNLAPDCALLSLVDKMSTRGFEPDAEPWRNHVAIVGSILESFFGGSAPRDAVAGGGPSVLANPVPLLNGSQIMAEFGLAPGPQIGRLIDALREAQAIGEVTDAAGARAWLAEQITGEGKGY